MRDKPAYNLVPTNDFQRSLSFAAIRSSFDKMLVEMDQNSQNFSSPPIFCIDARILDIRRNFHEMQEFYAFADILGGHQYFMILLDFVAANICVYFQYLFMHLCMHQYFWRNCFDLTFKIDIVVMII